jgi:hypothetical protein
MERIKRITEPSVLWLGNLSRWSKKLQCVSGKCAETMSQRPGYVRALPSQEPLLQGCGTDRVLTHAASRELLNAQARVRDQTSLCRICGGHSDTGAGFHFRTYAYTINYHSAVAPLSYLPSGAHKIGPFPMAVPRDSVSSQTKNN